MFSSIQTIMSNIQYYRLDLTYTYLTDFGSGRLIVSIYCYFISEFVLACNSLPAKNNMLHNLTAHIFYEFNRLVMTAVMLFIDEDTNLVETRTI